MPDLFLYASTADCRVLSKNINLIGPVLRKATIYAFPDLENDINKVAVFIVAHQGGDNIPPLQIIGMASWSEAREKRIETWKKALAEAWWTLMDTNALFPHRKRFPVEKVEIWPTIPKGSWGLVGLTVRSIDEYL